LRSWRAQNAVSFPEHSESFRLVSGTEHVSVPESEEIFRSHPDSTQ